MRKTRRNPFAPRAVRGLLEAGRGLGIIVNPKNFDPCFPFAPRHLERTVAFYVGSDMIRKGFIYSGDDRTRELGPKMGSGYFDDQTSAEYDTSASGYPRVHTPDGVRVSRRGHGTVLYTSMCLGAKLTSDGELDLEMTPEAPGISSNENRSSSAEKWWKQARERGLAYREYVEGGDTTTNSYESRANIDRRSQGTALWDEAAEYMADREGYSSNDLSSMSIDIEATFEVEEEGGEQAVDVYPWTHTRQRKAAGMKGAETLCAFYGVSDGLLTVPEDFWFNDDVYSTILLDGCAPEVIDYVQQVARLAGRPDLFEQIALVSILSKNASDFVEAEQDPYEDLRPFPNPSKKEAARQEFLKSLTKKERILLEKRTETIERLGIAAFDIDD